MPEIDADLIRAMKLERKVEALEDQLRLLYLRYEKIENALREIEALDRQGHDSEVAAEMGYIARQALPDDSGPP